MRAFWVAAVIVAIDQATKVAVVRTMHLGQSIPVAGDVLKFTFTENPGMAFGITVGPKGMITGFALVATILIAAYLYRLRHHYAPYRYSLGFILGGALGNIVDRLFYGLIHGYGPLFQGKVVDFIHVDLWRGYLNPWNLVPFVDGQSWFVALFPIWNVADMAIVVGVVGILFFQQRFHEEIEAEMESEQQEAPPADAEHSSNGGASAPAQPPHVQQSAPHDELAPPGEDAESSAASRTSEA